MCDVRLNFPGIGDRCSFKLEQTDGDYSSKIRNFCKFFNEIDRTETVQRAIERRQQIRVLFRNTEFVGTPMGWAHFDGTPALGPSPCFTLRWEDEQGTPISSRIALKLNSDINVVERRSLRQRCTDERRGDTGIQAARGIQGIECVGAKQMVLEIEMEKKSCSGTISLTGGHE